MAHRSSVRMTGPLAKHQDGLLADLLACGYAPLSARNLLWVAAHLSRWLERKRLSLSDLTPVRIAEFLRHRRKRGYVCWHSSKGLVPILSSLRSRGLAPSDEPPQEQSSPAAKLLREYETHLVCERGILIETAAGYTRLIRRLLDSHYLSDWSKLDRLSTETVSSMLLRAVRGSSVGYAKLKVTVLRSFLRYLHVRGLCRDLSAAVSAVAGHALAGLPKAIPEHEVRRLSESCDRRTATGRRDFAVLLLLSRLGLRACEVAALDLDDVRWRSGEIRVRGKGGQAILPLPQDVGDAVADYLKRGRPASTSRTLFLRARAPYQDLGRKTVGDIVRRVSLRAGLPPMGAHRLRHSAATSMLRRGASLADVARVLRHRSLQTTAIYAKVDRTALQGLARPWLGSAS
jgi:integrase/recombinase XerD